MSPCTRPQIDRGFDALDAYAAALDRFDRLKDRESVAALQNLRAEVLDGLREFTLAWQAREEALRWLPEGGNPRRIHTILRATACAARDQGRPRSALAFQLEVLENARHWNRDGAMLEAVVGRSLILADLGHTEAAARDVADALARLARLSDPLLARRFAIDVHTAAGEVAARQGAARSAWLRDHVCILWNANNTFGFDRVDWPRLAQAATITTVSRFMKHCMWQVGVDALVIPNGLSAEAFLMPGQQEVAAIRRCCSDRTLLAKIARWDPDKRWLLAIRIVRTLKDAGARPVLVARGGSEQHGSEVFDEALRLGLRVASRPAEAPAADGIAQALDDANDTDIINVISPLDAAGTRCLLHAADVVLANSGREPFGLVGLETMAVGGVACTGCTGEDYAVPGKNAIVQQTNDPREFLGLFTQLRSDAQGVQALRDSGAATARDYAWPVILQRNLLPRAMAMFGIWASRIA